jgi:phage terminase large subunit-like protein
MTMAEQLSDQQLGELLKAAEQEQVSRNTDKLLHYRPQPKQRTFHELGATKRERLFMAANRVGKTYCGAMEVAMHATGRYPSWWKGKRFKRPTRIWACSITGLLTRDGVQRLLCGSPLPAALGTGALPKKDIINTSASKGASEALDKITVRHVTGGVSEILFKSYEQGRAKFQADAIDVIWADEEMDDATIYGEMLARIVTTKGLIMMTATPLLGMSTVVKRFLQDDDEGASDREVVRMELDEAEHLSQEDKDKAMASYLPHEREARAKGIPFMGSGRIYHCTEETITVDRFELPPHWCLVSGMDFGIDHPTAAAWLAWDRDADCVYVTDCYRERGQGVIYHAANFKARGSIPMAWPHDGHQRDKGGAGAGVAIAQQYRQQGVKMLPKHAQYTDSRSNSRYAAILDIDDRMKSGRFKVFKSCEAWFEEYRMYHFKEGKIVMKDDDLMSATEYAMMSLNYAKPKSNVTRTGKRTQTVASGVDFDVHG